MRQDHVANYFEKIQAQVDECHTLAQAARSQGRDPETKVAIRLAKNMAERVEGLIGVVAPQIIGSGVTKRIIELEKEYSPSDWRVALTIAKEVAQEKFCSFKDKKEALEVGIRVGFTYQTGGIVSAPLEGFIGLKIKKTRDNTEYFAPCYAGPIRGAGGTAAAFSLIIADYVRTQLGFSSYDPTEDEMGRIKTEIYDYHEWCVNLQYLPSMEELDFLVHHLPIQLDGDPTEEKEVSNFKDLSRVDTNRVRGGICLVLAEGLAQKAPKIWKRLEVWGDEFGLSHWKFLEEFLRLQKQMKSRQVTKASNQKLSPNYTFIADLVAGRPILTYPLRYGGFRLRYGRSRLSGFSAASIHPATMHVVNNVVATGTQLKIERPGKAASITPCDTIQGPIVKLHSGEVKELKTKSQAQTHAKDIEEIIFLGDILINYGDFSENGHMLVPCGYNEEWWLCELKEKESTTKRTEAPTFDEAAQLSKAYGIPLHPQFIYYYTALSYDELNDLHTLLKKAKIEDAKIILTYSEVKGLLEKIGVPHIVINKEFIVVEKDNAKALISTFDLQDVEKTLTQKESVLESLNELSEYTIMDKAGTFIGARMGRPEKAKLRELTGSPQVLFPVGDEGGRLRCFQSALEAKKITAEISSYVCETCGKTHYPVCDVCSKKTKQEYFCHTCGAQFESSCKLHGPNQTFKRLSIDISREFGNALKVLKTRTYPDLIKGVRGTSNKDHIPEHLIKGILRSKHDVYVNKDGTIRFDMTELPITHFKPKEIGTSIEKLHELGYTHDVYDKPLVDSEQIVELFAQDIILPAATEALDEQSDQVLFRSTKFIDELLTSYYKLKAFYNLSSAHDLVGHLVIGLAPHISSGMVGRIIGFSNTQGCFAHPLWHAALRRDCDGDENCVILLLDGLLNFSGQFLPNSRGAKTMDAPLVLTSILNPNEVDDQAHGLDIAFEYPLTFYQAAQNYKNPWDVKVEQIKHRLNTPQEFAIMGFTHDVSNMNIGVSCSSYKSLPSMQDKLKGQMEIAEKIRAVDEADVAKLVIEKHFIRDMKGNLRKYSMQQFRCVKCNEKYRRPPLIGKCTVCFGKIIFTISEGSIVKYLEPSISLANKYNIPVYVKQSLEIVQNRIESIFGREKEKQVGLGKWFG